MWVRLTSRYGLPILVNMARVNEVYSFTPTPADEDNPTRAKLYFGIGEDDEPTEVRETLDEIETQIREASR